MTPSVSVAEVGDDCYLLDVREDEEWAAGHAPAAHHVPMMEVPARLAEIPADADLVVVCKVGGRSAQVVAFLAQQGVSSRNLNGGMLEWAAAGRPVVGEDGQPGFVL